MYRLLRQVMLNSLYLLQQRARRDTNSRWDVGRHQSSFETHEINDTKKQSFRKNTSSPMKSWPT